MNKREKIYWAVMAAIAIGLICAYVFWVAPIRSRVKSETEAFYEQQRMLNELYMARSMVPSQGAIEGPRRYIAWLQNELASNVVGFFKASADTLHAPIVADDGSGVSPSRFKAEYQKRRDELVNRFPRTWTSKKLFPEYPWLGEGLPSERDFDRISQDYNIRREILVLMLTCSALNVDNVEIAVDKRSAGDMCGYIPVSFKATVPADRLETLINGLMRVSWRDGRQSLCMVVRKIQISRAEGEAAAQMAVNVTIELEVLDFSPALASSVGI